MGLSITHTTQSPVTDDLQSGIIGPDEWNEAHTISATVRTVTAATDTLTSADLIVYVNRAGAVTITLPDAATWLAANAHGLPLRIKGINGAEHTNNITINRAGSDTIDGATSYVITSDYGSVALRPAATNLWATL